MPMYGNFCGDFPKQLVHCLGGEHNDPRIRQMAGITRVAVRLLEEAVRNQCDEQAEEIGVFVWWIDGWKC